MSFFLTLLIGGLLLVVFELNSPLSGIKVGLETFQLALDRMQEIP